MLLVQRAASFEVREALLEALRATTTFRTLHAIANGAVLRCLDRWLGEGEADRQSSFLVGALQALRTLPITLPLLQVRMYISGVLV